MAVTSPSGMMLLPRVARRWPPAGYAATAVEFDGANDWIDYGDVSALLANSKLVTMSTWLRFPTWPAADGCIFNINSASAQRFALLYEGATSGALLLSASDENDARVLLATLEGIPVDDWFNLLVSTNMASGVQVYLNDADWAANLSPIIFTDAEIGFAASHASVGRVTAEEPTLFDGLSSDLWVNPGVALDLSVQANRRRFIDGAGRPVDLGPAGELPTGSRPKFFHSGAVGSWHTNRGTVPGGTLTGALTAAPNGPSD